MVRASLDTVERAPGGINIRWCQGNKERSVLGNDPGPSWI